MHASVVTVMVTMTTRMMVGGRGLQGPERAGLVFLQ
jgi:hypothetical protein